MSTNITITGKLTDIAAGNDTAASVAFRLVNYGAGPPRVAGASILSDVFLKPTISGTGTFSQALYANDQINPGASNSPPQTFYEFTVYNDQGSLLCAASYQFTGSGSFDISNLVPLQNPFIAGPAGANSVLPVVFVPIAHQFLTGMNISGVFSSAQPAASDLTNGTTGSGAVVLAASPAITGTVTGGASYTAPTITGPTITGTIAGSPTITTPTLTSPTNTGTSTFPNSATFDGTTLTGRNNGSLTVKGADSSSGTGQNLILDGGLSSNFGSGGGNVLINAGVSGGAAQDGNVTITGGGATGIALNGSDSTLGGEPVRLQWAGNDVLKTSGLHTVTVNGTLDTYNSIATVLNGIPSEYASVNLTAQTAAITTTTLYAVPATGGPYRLTWYAKVTTPATTGAATSTLGALTIVFTDPDNVAQTITCGAQVAAGTIATTSTGNTTTTVLLGLPMLLNCKASTNITYAFAYASNTANQMAYSLRIVLERL